MKQLWLLLTIGTLSLQAQDLHYSSSGSGESLVLIHGFAADSSVWNAIIPVLSETYHVISLDLRGHGSSPKPATGYTLAEFAEDIHTLITNLGIEDPLLVGWSLGGYIAQYYALNYPVKKMILVATSPAWVPENGFPFGSSKEEHQAGYDKLCTDPAAYYEECINANFTEHCSEYPVEDLKAGLRRVLYANDPAALAQIVSYFTKKPLSLVSALPTLAVPTLIVSGSKDPVSPPALGKCMKDMMPHATWYTIECAGHLLIQTHAKLFTQVILNYLHNRALPEGVCIKLLPEIKLI